MLAKLHLFAFFICVTSLLLVNANPERRQVSSFVNSLTSAVGSDITSGFGHFTSAAAGVFTTVTSIAGSAATVVTSAGGQAVTLAGSGAGAVTSFAGSEYTVATAAAASFTSKTNAAVGVSPGFGFSLASFTALVTVVGGAFIGALITL